MDEEKKEDVVKTEPITNNGEIERKGFNITSMILGIISIIGFCWWFVSIPTSIIAIIFSVAGKKDAGRGMGIAGMVLGIISLALWILLFVCAFAGIAVFGDELINSLNTVNY